MTDAELDARVASLSDDDVRGILDGTDEARLLWYRPGAMARGMAAEILRLRAENAALRATERRKGRIDACRVVKEILARVEGSDREAASRRLLPREAVQAIERMER